jgi:hypothetical protein
MKLTDLTNETEGASEGKWFDFTFSDGKTQSLKLASSSSQEYQNFAAQRWNAARRGRQNVPPMAALRIVCDGIVKHLLKDWKGDAITEDDGATPAPFNEKNVRAVIEGKSLDASALRDFIIEQAGTAFNFCRTNEFEPDATGKLVPVKNLNGEALESASPADQVKSRAEVAPGVVEAPPAPAGA